MVFMSLLDLDGLAKADCFGLLQKTATPLHTIVICIEMMEK